MSTIINDEFSGNAATATTATTAGSVDAGNLTGTTLAANVVTSSLTDFGTVNNITMTDAGAIRTTTTSGQSVYFSAYDNNGATYVPMMYMTAGNTPSLTISNGVGAGTLSVTGATIGAISMTMGTGGFITLGTGDAVRTTTTVGETWLMQAYDTNDATYRTFGTFTAGTTPTMALSAPTGGSATIDNITIGGTTRAAGSFSSVGVGKTATSNSIDTLANINDLTTVYYNLQPASGNGLLQIKSGTGTGFVPSLFGTGDDSNDFGLSLVGQCTPGNDTGTTALVRIDGRQNDGTTLDTRPILSVTNLAVNRLTLSAAGEMTLPLQPAFLAYRSANVSNVTGAGTVYTVPFNTEVFDQGSDYNNGTYTFTAPVTGRYYFSVGIGVFGLTAAMTQATIDIVTSNRTYRSQEWSWGTTANASASLTTSFSVFADMDAADTALVQLTISNGAGDTADLDGGTTPARTFFAGHLVC